MSLFAISKISIPVSKICSFHSNFDALQSELADLQFELELDQHGLRLYDRCLASGKLHGEASWAYINERKQAHERKIAQHIRRIAELERLLGK